MRTTPVILRRDGADPAADAADAERRLAEERSERLRFSLPLLVLAGASLLIAYVLFHASLAPHASRMPLWVLAFSVGVIASAGGSASLLVGDFSGDAWLKEARSSPEYVVVERAAWVALQSELRSARTDRTTSSAEAAAPELVLPEWEEPREVRGPSEVPAAAADLSPPAPMSVTHGIDSLASEVDRLVADLESAANAAPPAPPAPAATATTAPPHGPRIVPPPPSWARPGPKAPGPAEGPAPKVVSPPVATPPTKARTVPALRPSAPPAERSKPTPPTPAAPPDDAEVEYRKLLSELEQRAGRASSRPKLELPAAPSVSADVRCVGCDARLGPNDQGEPCRSCRSPMCPSCRDRSAKEGYRGLCAVCSILGESEGRGAGTDR
ncbi:MAG: hypothetical protein L3K00_01565 [Thermoplasmata archaeon]|nr:hypothetical protein [Thermoplasmata archaeon]MCI4361954.1 hypothetical protein [Thermoplasmata archaeon]